MRLLIIGPFHRNIYIPLAYAILSVTHSALFTAATALETAVPLNQTAKQQNFWRFQNGKSVNQIRPRLNSTFHVEPNLATKIFSFATYYQFFAYHLLTVRIKGSLLRVTLKNLRSSFRF